MREVAIVSAVRTAVGKAGKGNLKDTRPDTLAGHVIRAAVERSGVAPEDVEDVILGCAMPEAEQGMNVARIAMFMGGLPETTSANTAKTEQAMRELTRATDRFEILGGEGLAHRAAAAMGGLGFSREDMKQPARNLSGGWLMRAALARLLVDMAIEKSEQEGAA